MTPQTTSIALTLSGKPKMTHPFNNLTSRRTRQGFTLVELLTVIGIIGLLAVITFPFMSSMRQSNAQTSTEVSITGAVSAARQLAALPLAQFDPISSGGGQEAAGAAIIVTNSGQIRLVQHNPALFNGTTRYGFSDVINREAVELPNGTHIVGIFRNSTTSSGLNQLQMITPPFAIRFDPNGQLLHGTPGNTEYNVYYDGDYDGTINIGSIRPNEYDPDSLEDPNNNQKWFEDANGGRYELPFEQIESVMGIAIFNLEEGISVVPDNGERYLNQTSVEQILEQGRVLFFNRYSGAPVKVNQR